MKLNYLQNKGFYMTIKFFDDLIKPFGKYGYFIVSIICALAAGYFMIGAVLAHNFISGIVTFIFMFVIGYCWNKDTERILNE